MTDLWTSANQDVRLGDELVGFTVEGRDGTIGKIDHVNFTGTCISVAVGMLKKKTHVIPAAAVDAVDLDSETVVVRLTKDEVTGGPELDPHLGVDEACEARIQEYYGELLAGSRT